MTWLLSLVIAVLSGTLGLVAAGVVSALGDGVRDWQIGDPVGVCPSSLTSPGYRRDGGYTFKATARQEDIVRIPDGVTFEQVKPQVPFVVRLNGTNEEEGQRLLAEAELPNVTVAATMDGAEAKVVELAGS